MIFILLALLSFVQAPAEPSDPPTLVNQGAKAPIEQGTVTLHGGRGWLQSSRPLLDYDLQFEFRAIAEADPGLMLRTWLADGRSPSKNYRLTLPTRGDLDPDGLLVGRGQKVRVLQPGKVDLRPTGEWQAMQVTVEGERVRVALNGTSMGEFAVEGTGGYVTFDNRQGVIELRNIEIRELRGPFVPDVIRAKEWAKASGQTLQAVREVTPLYTSQAMRDRARGIVVMEAVVLADGSVGAVRLTRSLHRELDAAAIAALKKWKFRPAVQEGKAMPVVVEIEMTFTLK
jgi:TonB family protein